MITIEKKQDLWILGDVNGIKFEIKIYCPSVIGIKKGNIVKLFLYKKDYRKNNYICCVQYDRGWIKRPKEKRTVKALKEIEVFTAQNWEKLLK